MAAIQASDYEAVAKREDSSPCFMHKYSKVNNIEYFRVGALQECYSLLWDMLSWNYGIKKKLKMSTLRNLLFYYITIFLYVAETSSRTNTTPVPPQQDHSVAVATGNSKAEDTAL